MNTRKSLKTEILSGIHPVAEALAAGRRRIYRIYVNQDNPAKRVSKIAELARKKDIPVSPVLREEIRKMTDNINHQDIAAGTDKFPVSNLGSLYGQAGQSGRETFLLILDSIVDPHNLGALVRTAVCTGVSGIIIPRDRCAAPTPAVSRASAGALEHARIAVATNLANIMKDLKKNHFWIIGLDQKGGLPVYETDMTGARALVIGGEDTGIRPLVKRQCDFLCRIPQTVPLGSLNASVAGGIAMYEALRQRMKKEATKKKGSG
ncbi:MAG: 23S rRNA (guanosine(2251)-2'-O)-methyltransferase RlmB [Desulfosalsimonas sp.]